MRFKSSLSLLFSILMLVGCGDDDGTPLDDAGVGADTRAEDSGPVPDGSVEDGAVEDAALPNCTGLANGVSCGEGLLCLMDVCVSTRCGDGFVDSDADEVCDDGNDTDGDGCDSCAFSCDDAAACDDMDPCTGTETCSADHICEAGTPPAAAEAVACELEDAMPGVCVAGRCSAPGCGNGAVDGDEACDDGNEVNGDGCETDCSFSCVENVDCLDGDLCNGEEICDVDTHMCSAAAEALDCDDTEACTADSCDADVGCRNLFIDEDSDGYSPMTCTGDLLGDDCDDDDGTTNPGADELCDTVDHDCSGDPDDHGDVVVECLLDRDGDGYGNVSQTMSICSCPDGYIPPRADEEVDCADFRGSVNPGQTEYFSTAYCRSSRLCPRPYDYNCDGDQTQEVTRVSSGCLGGRFGCVGSGWIDEVPACGVEGEYRSCAYRSAGMFIVCGARVSERTQSCH